MKRSTRNKSKTLKETTDNDFVDDDTMYFIQLWDYVQSFEQSIFDSLFSAEDVVLLNELVDGQNFSVALDMLRQKIGPIRKKLPEELQDIARLPRCRKVSVKTVNQYVQPPELEEFRERLKNAKTFVPIPPEKCDDFLEKKETTSLIADQNAAYEEALLQDQLKEVIEQSIISYEMEKVDDPEPFWTLPQKQEKQEKTCEETSPKKRKQSFSKTHISEEPNESNKDCVTVQVTVPFKDGLKLERRFHLFCDLVGAVIGWLSNILEVDESELSLCTNFPKVFYSFATPLNKCPVQRKRIQFFCELQTR